VFHVRIRIQELGSGHPGGEDHGKYPWWPVFRIVKQSLALWLEMNLNWQSGQAAVPVRGGCLNGGFQN
jgi:hypothetical protein